MSSCHTACSAYLYVLVLSMPALCADIWSARVGRDHVVILVLLADRTNAQGAARREEMPMGSVAAYCGGNRSIVHWGSRRLHDGNSHHLCTTLLTAVPLSSALSSLI